MSDSQRAAIYAAGDKESDQCYAAWVANLDTAKIDWADSPRTAPLMDGGPPEATTLKQALALADTVVEGQVTAVNDASNTGVTIAISVSRVFKGSAGSSLALREWSSLHGNSRGNPKAVDIWEPPGSYLLTPGEDVFAFAQGSWPEPYSGEYLVENGTIKAVGGNPFASDLDGMSADAFAQLIAADLSA